MRSTGSPPAPSASWSARTSERSPSRRHRISRRNGWSTGWAGLPRPIPALICGSRPTCIQSISRAKRSISASGTVMAIGAGHLDDDKPWSRWFEAAGIADAELPRGLVLNRRSMLIDAAIDGQGVALALTTLAAGDLINGRIVRPFDIGLRSKAFWIVCPKASSAKPKIKTFREWLLAEAADGARRLKKLLARGEGWWCW